MYQSSLKNKWNLLKVHWQSNRELTPTLRWNNYSLTSRSSTGLSNNFSMQIPSRVTYNEQMWKMIYINNCSNLYTKLTQYHIFQPCHIPVLISAITGRTCWATIKINFINWNELFLLKVRAYLSNDLRYSIIILLMTK